ncbi:unnamed protein product, partial [Staurois parvus]
MTLAIPADYVCSDSHLVPDHGLNRLPSKHLNLGRAYIPCTGASCLQTYLRAPAVLQSGPPTSNSTGDLCNFGPDSRCPTLRGVRNLAAREALSPLASITRLVSKSQYRNVQCLEKVFIPLDIFHILKRYNQKRKCVLLGFYV